MCMYIYTNSFVYFVGPASPMFSTGRRSYDIDVKHREIQPAVWPSSISFVI